MSIVHRRAVPLTLVLLMAIAALATAGVGQPVRADDPSVNDAIAAQQRMEAELARQRAQLADLRREQTELTASLAKLVTDLDSVGLELEAAQRQLELVTTALEKSRADLVRYRVQITNLEADLREVAADIQSTRLELRGREALLQEHLRAAYEQSQTSILEVLLSTESFSEASSRLGYMLTLSDEDRRLAEEIRNTRERLKVRRQTLSDGRKTLADLEAAAAERTAALDQQQREVDAARQKLEAFQLKLQQLQEAQQSQLAAAARGEIQTRELIAAEERALAGQHELVARLKEEANRLDIAYRGRFEWPERGDFMVTQEFGYTVFNPNHTGIDLSYDAPRCGGPIYAAAGGTVLADGRPNLAYGDTAIGVVIGHSQRLQTWYWHFSNEVVSVGQQVATGDLIGYEGATGMATGCHLHFQVMFDDTPASPRNYLP
ncbi:MAG TPA: peptidoglycan DD-metalloendopeptidase family protein [Candidatus Binatia bacterium]|nr:peptidoglycan DD-metalloendopeptidase family protein [Candidatus Binatia bacterium]